MINSYLNQIFYKNNKFDDPLTLIQLEKWMLIDILYKAPNVDLVQLDDKMPNIGIISIEDKVACADISPKVELANKNSVIEISNIISTTAQIPRPMADFTPRKEDTLFWCAYTIYHGQAGYHIIGNRYRNTEIQEKQRILDYIRANPLIFKGSSQGTGHKISNVCIQEIQSELMVNKKTSWMTFWMLCVFYQFHAIIVYDQTYIEFNPFIANSSGPIETFRFTRNRDGHISVDLTPLDTNSANTIREKCIHLDHTRQDEPLKSASHYKVAVLEEMAAKLGISKETLCHKPKKADWYAAVSNKCKW